MITTPLGAIDVERLEPCPLCQEYEFIDMEEAQVLPIGRVQADINCTECGLRVCGDSLREAIVDWNRLSAAMQVQNKIG